MPALSAIIYLIDSAFITVLKVFSKVILRQSLQNTLHMLEETLVYADHALLNINSGLEKCTEAYSHTTVCGLLSVTSKCSTFLSSPHNSQVILTLMDYIQIRGYFEVISALNCKVPSTLLQLAWEQNN